MGLVDLVRRAISDGYVSSTERTEIIEEFQKAAPEERTEAEKLFETHECQAEEICRSGTSCSVLQMFKIEKTIEEMKAKGATQKEIDRAVALNSGLLCMLGQTPNIFESVPLPTSSIPNNPKPDEQ